MKFNRVLLKLSGESLAGKLGNGIDPDVLNGFANEIASLHKLRKVENLLCNYTYF